MLLASISTLQSLDEQQTKILESYTSRRYSRLLGSCSATITLYFTKSQPCLFDIFTFSILRSARNRESIKNRENANTSFYIYFLDIKKSPHTLYSWAVFGPVSRQVNLSHFRSPSSTVPARTPSQPFLLSPLVVSYLPLLLTPLSSLHPEQYQHASRDTQSAPFVFEQYVTSRPHPSSPQID